MTVDAYVLAQLADGDWWDARYRGLFQYQAADKAQYRGMQVRRTCSGLFFSRAAVAFQRHDCGCGTRPSD